MAAAAADRSPRSRTDQLALFAAMWALAHAWHVVGNPTLAPGWAQLAIGAGVLAVLLRPGAVAPLALLAGAGVTAAWTVAPTLPNHLLLLALVDLGILLAATVGVARRRPWDRLDLADRALPVARLCLLGFYAFAAFAKLNRGFFDPAVSCAVVFFEESTSSLGADAVRLGDASWLQHLVIWGTAAIELAVPVLLLVRRTRHLGVLVALAFHLVVALDRSHQFFDFSAALVALFVLFLPAGAGTWLAERTSALRARLALQGDRVPELAHALAVAPVVGAVAVVGLTPVTYAQGVDIGYLPFLAYNLAVLAMVARYLRGERPVADVRLVPHHPAFWLVPLLVVANGTTPYLELKTGFGWNMYANLRTVDGESNHLVVRRTLPLTDAQADPVEVLATDDPALRWYQVNGYALPVRTLRAHLADRPGTTLTYRQAGRVVELERADEAPELVEPVPELQRRLQHFRAIDLRSPPERCAPVIGPLG